jgi:regulatory protein
MPTITQILPQKRRANRRNVHLDGQFAFGCNINVVAKFRLREGMTLTPEQVREIQLGEVKQECFDRALKFLAVRLHGRGELSTKLMRHEYGQTVVQAVLDDLTRLEYIDDERFAREFAAAATGRRQFGRRRAMMELMRKGIDRGVANRALDQVYETHDDLTAARTLIEKKAPALKRLSAQVARRRLAGQLLRRGFDYQTVAPLIDEALGQEDEE